MKKNITIGVLTVVCLIIGCIAYWEWSDKRVEVYDEEYSYIKLGGYSAFTNIDTESEIPGDNFFINNEMAVKIGVAVLEDYIKPEEFKKMSIGLMDIESKGFFVVGAYYEGKLGGGTSVAILKKNGKILKVFGSE